jgi:hypothetical protein
MLRETLSVWALLLVAAFLEAGGDALVRMGLRGPKWALAGGSFALVLYGLLVNLTRWDFSRLMGVYIAIFFVVARPLPSQSSVRSSNSRYSSAAASS